MRERLSARRERRRATRGERELRRAEARALRHDHATFDEGRRDPGGSGGI
jgi:hypothetical protein